MTPCATCAVTGKQAPLSVIKEVLRINHGHQKWQNVEPGNSPSSSTRMATPRKKLHCQVYNLGNVTHSRQLENTAVYEFRHLETIPSQRLEALGTILNTAPLLSATVNVK